jgi:hypothetical protein
MTEEMQDTHEHSETRLRQKLAEAELPGSVVEFDPDEADEVGAFSDDAITIDDAQASAADLLDEVP